MVEVKLAAKGALKHGGSALGRIHASSNHKKALTYWLGFLKGVLASKTVEKKEYGPLRIEAENFLNLLHDPDAHELIEDIRIWENEPRQLYYIIENIISVRSRDVVIETEKDEFNEFFGFCAGIACDNQITPAEVEQMLAKLDSYPSLSTDTRIKNLRRSALLAIADGRITPEESEDICAWITHLVGESAADTGIATFGNVGVIDGAIENFQDVLFDRKMFVLTGKFSLGPRKSITTMIAERGGASKNTVCAATHYLCVAAEASRDWRTSHAGTKIIRAMELRANGQGPNLVQEPTLARALSLL